MKIDATEVRRCLKSFDFETLFREQLGWDNYQGQLDITVGGKNVQLTALAQKRGFVAFCCPSIPDRATRLKIDHQVTKSAREHFVIYADQPAGQQVWHWVRREPGKPLASRDHRFDTSQPGDPLIQRLEKIAVSLAEEEMITVSEVAGRAQAAFDVDKVTKKFYDRFKTEHAAFLKLIKGIKAEGDLQWYTSLMLNRLMFIYFIQKKGFLDGDLDYLRNRLAMVRQAKGKDKFQSFYRYFLLRLFHDGLGKSPDERKLDAAMGTLLGRVPYLNGGFFEVHQLEEHNLDIDIPDKAFQKLFDFFDQYSWHLDERPLRADNEINPDVVGYIFEKYINQKQMGAYYTKEDITEYISKNTIVPFLFDVAEKKCAIAFRTDSSLWRMLRDDPDRYIYRAVRYGVIDEMGTIIPLPKDIEGGVTNAIKRDEWNRSATDPYALPTETWREHVARRKRCLEIREKLGKGEIHEINDLITLNLDIWQFARDAILTAEGPELLRAFWEGIEKVTILDPTCGSGAFLFAALRILETLYSDCLERMERFVEDLGGKPHHPEQFSDFKDTLARIEKHPNQSYFILKSIIINNLFGVDIMAEAVEICKLRLFLKLVAQVDAADQIEPLPDIDFNIRSGNSLVGFATAEQVRKSFTEDRVGNELQAKLLLGNAADDYGRFLADLEIVDRSFRQFRAKQTAHGGRVTHDDKEALRNRLAKLDDQLDLFLAREYGVKIDRKRDFEAWRSSHEPFHWLVEFYSIMQAGGFDVVIGNPPYVVFSEAKIGYGVLPGQYQTLPAKNLYAFVFERSIDLAQPGSPVGLIVQLTAISAERLPSLQDFLSRRGRLVAVPFPRRPESVFEGVEMPVVILLSSGSGQPGNYLTSRVNRFYTEERPSAIASLQLTVHCVRLHGHRIAKFGTDLEQSIYRKLAAGTTPIATLTVTDSKSVLYYQEACRYWLKAFDELPYFTRNGERMEPPHGRVIACKSANAASFMACLLNSSLFYWYYSAFSDCEHVNDVLLRSFSVPHGILGEDWVALGSRLMKRLKETASRKTINTKQGHTIQYDEMKAVNAKPIIDEVDRVLARHYRFTDEELDLITNYDIKYRLGSGGDALDM